MKKEQFKLKKDGLPYKGVCSLILLLLSSCQTLDTQFQLQDYFAVKVKWRSQLVSGEKETMTSYLFVKGKSLLRADFLIPFRGPVLNMIVHKNQMLVRMPTKKTYYKGPFHSQAFFPQLMKFSSQELIALLRAKPLDTWNCTSLREHKMQCRIGKVHLEWKFKNKQWETLSLTYKDKGQLQAQILEVLDHKVQKDLFSPSLKGYKKQKRFP